MRLLLLNKWRLVFNIAYFRSLETTITAEEHIKNPYLYKRQGRILFFLFRETKLHINEPY